MAQELVSRPVRLGLKANWQQFSLLVLINGFVGAMIGLERTVVPLMGEELFHQASRTAVLSFLLSFGLVKAASNLAAGRLCDRIGRKPVLVAGWLAGLPAPLVLIYAPNWNWVVLANVFLGVNQGLCWSATVIMKIDLAGPQRRGLAMGLNEFAGYLAVSLAALASGYLAAAYGLRAAPFYPGLGLAAVGLLASVALVRETRGHARRETELQVGGAAGLSFARVVGRTSWGDRSLFATCQAGLVNNLNDGMVWGLLPLWLAGAGLPVTHIALVAATYPAVWGVGQMASGALSDRWGRKGLIVAGMWVQAASIGLLVAGRLLSHWLAGAALLGLGTAMVYPTLLAAVSDVAHPSWRASAVGVYRLWRDGGYAAGALLAGTVADRWGLMEAMVVVAALTGLSGVVVAGVMGETLPARRGQSG